MALAVVFVAAMQATLPVDFRLTEQSHYAFTAVLGVLLLVLIIGDPGRIDRDRRWLRVVTGVLFGVITLAAGAAAIRLVAGILAQAEFASAQQLLAIGGVVWLTNVIGFALWFWDLDDGGAPSRAARGSTRNQAFLFPEMEVPDRVAAGWYPRFIDYLALSFYTALAFGPADVSPLRPWAKLAMICEALISLVLAALVLARAINVL